MAIPLLLGGIAKGIVGGTAKGAATGAAKKFVTGKGKKKGKAEKNVKTKAKSKVEQGDKKFEAKVKPKKKMVSTVKIPDSVYKKDSDSASQTTDSNVSFESLQKQLDSINKTTSSLTDVGKQEVKTKKKLVREEKKKKKAAKAKAKEERLEKKKKGGSGLLGAVIGAADQFNIFNFLKNVGLGVLAVSILENIDTVTEVLSGLIENFTNPLKIFRNLMVGLATILTGPVKATLKLIGKGVKKTASLTKKVVKKMTPAFKKAFSNLSTGISNLVKRTAAAAGRGAAGGGAAAAAAKKGATTPLKAQASQAAAKSASQAAKQQASKATAKNLFGKGGARLLKFGKIFRSSPVVGGFIGMFIDLLLGEPLDRAIVGGIGSGLGAWAGGFLGTLLFPGLGTAAGAFIGSALGDWAGKSLYGLISKKTAEIPKVDPKDKMISSIDMSTQASSDKDMKVGQQRNIGGLMMVWDGQNYVTQQQYTQQTGKQPIPVGQSTPTQPAVPNQPTGTRPSTGGITKEQRSLLDSISFAEGTRKSYGTIFGGKVVPELAQGKLTIGQVLEMQRTGMLNGRNVGYGTSYNSDATGRYQFMSFVLREEMQKQGYTLDTLLTPELQDKMILGRISRFRGVTPALLAKEGLSTRVLDMLAPEFASFPYSPKGGRIYYDQPVKTAGSIRDAYNKSLGMPQSSQPTPTMQPASQQTSSVPLGRTDPFAPVQPAQLAQQQNQTVTTQGTINDMYKGATNTSQFPTTSGYGMRVHPISGKYKMHTGVDIAPPGPGYFVGLKAPGKVTRVGNDPGGYGKFVIITSQETGYSYMFAHMATIDVKTGEQYTGQPIGEMGTTGGSTGIHLHYEVYKGGKDGPAINPEPFMNLLTMGKVDGQVRSQTAQVSPNQQTPNQSARVSSRPSYDPYSDTENAGGSVVPSIGDQPQASGAGGGGAPMMGGPSTQQVLNSYYKSQLLGFLYKQG